MSESHRRSTRPHVPAKTPEERLMPLVDQASKSSRSEESSVVDNGIREGENLPTASEPAGSGPAAPPALPGSEAVDHPTEGPDWKESDIELAGGFGDENFQQMLRNVASAGRVFNGRAIQGMRMLRAPMMLATDHTPTRVTDHPSSGRKVESHSGQSKTTATDRPLSGRSVENLVRTTTRVTDRPSLGRNVESQSGQSETRILERPQTDPAPQATLASAVSARASDANVGNVGDELAILAIGVQSATGEIKQAVTSMKVKVGCSLSVTQVMRRLKEGEEAKTYYIRQLLEPMSANRVEIRTAQTPMHISQVAEMREKDRWLDTSEMLGKLDDVNKLETRTLAPCVTCEEEDDIRKAAGQDVPSSAQIFVIYIFELEGNPGAGRSSHRRELHEEEGTSGAPFAGEVIERGSMARDFQAGARPLLQEIVKNYLNAMIDEEDFRVYKMHVLEQRASQGAYPIIIFARLVEQACDGMRMPYNTGSSINKAQKMGNGPPISIADIVLFYGTKFPSDLAPAPSTFANHRSVYLRAKSCVANLENRELNEEDQTILRSVKEIVRTPLTELAKVRREAYGSLSAFKTRIEKLEMTYNKKGKGKEI